MPVCDVVAKLVEWAIVRAPFVLYPRMPEAHIVCKLVFEVLQQHCGTLLPLEIHAFVCIDVIAWRECKEHVYVVCALANLSMLSLKYCGHISQKLAL